MFSVIKSLVALNVIFLLVVSASLIGATGNQKIMGIGELGFKNECGRHNGVSAIISVTRESNGKLTDIYKDCASGQEYVLYPAHFSSFNILHMFSRCKVKDGKAGCV
jgi:hypothetical protein